jgi:hypothetical protein
MVCAWGTGEQQAVSRSHCGGSRRVVLTDLARRFLRGLLRKFAERAEILPRKLCGQLDGALEGLLPVRKQDGKTSGSFSGNLREG